MENNIIKKVIILIMLIFLILCIYITIRDIKVDDENSQIKNQVTNEIYI